MIYLLMNNHNPTLPAPNDTNLKILQLNTCRSWVVTHSLLNDPLTSSFHFLLIQEPYLTPMTNLPVAHANWTVVLPDHPTCPPNSPPEDTTTKSLIYASKSIPTTALAPIQTNSNCIAAARLSLPHHTVTLISAYAPPKQPHKLLDLRPLLTTPTSDFDHVLVAMDCNLHHALWNPPTYSHTHREADDLILTMSEAGLDLRSEKGTPTVYPSNPSHANTTVDLLWLSPACHEWATVCRTDVDHEYSHLSDHAAILTEISLPDPVPAKQPAYRRWKAFDPTTFENHLTAALETHSASLTDPLTSQHTLDD